MDFATCSFCGRKSTKEDVFIRGKHGCICLDCTRQLVIVAKRQDMSQRKSSGASLDANWQDITPKDLKHYLDQYVVGQEEAKKTLSIAIYNHYKRFSLVQAQAKEKKVNDVQVDKSNMLFIGETGVGKTFLLQTIAQKLKVPFCVVDAKSMTQAGYVGDDPESMISRLLQSANFDIEAAEWGIIFIDEIDKIAAHREGNVGGHDIGKGVQQAILKILEGCVVNVAPDGNKRHPDQRTVQVNTKNILFICGGAFDGIKSIVERRLDLAPIGFARKDSQVVKNKGEELMKYVTPQDLQSYGLIPELIARLHVIVYLHRLTKDLIKAILTEPQNAIFKQYKKLFAMDDIDLRFTPEALDAVVEDVMQHKLGARRLRATLEKILRDLMFELPGQPDKPDVFQVDEGYVREKLRTNATETQKKDKDSSKEQPLQEHYLAK